MDITKRHLFSFFAHVALLPACALVSVALLLSVVLLREVLRGGGGRAVGAALALGGPVVGAVRVVLHGRGVGVQGAALAAGGLRKEKEQFAITVLRFPKTVELYVYNVMEERN